MKFEKSCGAVVATKIDNKIKYLIIKSIEGIYGFPKGHMELDEVEEETALREILEETGIKVKLINGFRYKLNYEIAEQNLKILINKELKMELKEYCKGKQHYEYLFQSREGGNNPITRTRAYQILLDTGDVFGIHISCHTLRKTFGYTHYKQNNDVVYLMEIFNHATPRITLRYIGVMQDELDKSTEDISFL